MKKLILVICFISVNHIIAQVLLLDNEPFEVYFGTINADGQSNTFNVVTQTERRWDADLLPTSSYSGGSISISGSSNPDDNASWVNGFDFYVSSGSGYGSGYGGVLASSVYKITHQSPHNISFYLDFRDCRYPYDVDPNPDICIRFDGNSITFEYRLLNGSTWHSIDDDETIIVVNDNGLYGLSGSETDCFQLLTTLIESNEHPYIEWNPYYHSSIIGYYLYREIHDSQGTNVEKFPLPATTTSFLDEDFIMSGPLSAVVYYWVKARISSTQESLKGNTVSSRGHLSGQTSKLALDDKDNLDSKSLEFNLDQNYPNPFNPTTEISYSIAQKSNVKLRVYSSLGQVAAVLIDEILSEGIYTAQFNAENLPSGVYFYQLVTDHFSDVKKMIVAK